MYSRPSNRPRAIDNGTAQNSATSPTPESASAPVATNAATARVRTIETTSRGVRVRRVRGLAWRSRSSSESATASRSTALLTRKVVWKNAARVGESDTRRALAGHCSPHGTRPPAKGISGEKSTTGSHSTDEMTAAAATMTRSRRARSRPDGNASITQTSTNSASRPSVRERVYTHSTSEAARPRTA